jgi:hypothetical protein
VGRTGSGGEIVDRRVAEIAAEFGEIAARGRYRPGDAMAWRIIVTS